MPLAARVRTSFIAYTKYLKDHPLTPEQKNILQFSLQKMNPSETFTHNPFISVNSLTPSKFKTTIRDIKLRLLILFPLLSPLNCVAQTTLTSFYQKAHADFFRKPYKMSFQILLGVSGALIGWNLGLGPLWWGNIYVTGIGFLVNKAFVLLDIYDNIKKQGNCRDNRAFRVRSFINMVIFGAMLFYPPSIGILGNGLATIVIIPLAIRLGKTAAKLFNLFYRGETNSTFYLPSKKMVTHFLHTQRHQQNPENLGKAFAILATTQAQPPSSPLHKTPNVYLIIRNKGGHAHELTPAFCKAIEMICTQ